MPSTGEPIRDALELARDACAAMAAFLARVPAGVIVAWSPGEETEELSARVVELATSMVSHPAISPGGLVVVESPGHGFGRDSSPLACVAHPVSTDTGDVVALLGVVDSFLPDTDGEVGAVLRTLAGRIGELLAEEEEEPQPGDEELGPEEDLAALAAEAEAEVQLGSEAEPEAVPEPEPPAMVVEVRPGEPFLAVVADAITDGLLVARRDGTIVYANAGFATLAQRLPEELLGSDISSILLLGEGPARARHRDLTLLLGSPDTGRRALLVLPGGRDLPIEIRGRRLSNRVVGDIFVALVRDARQAQADAEAGPSPLVPSVLEDVFESIEDGVVVCDDDGRVVVANRVARQLLGIAEDSAGRPFPFDLELWTADGSPVRLEDHPISHALGGTTVLAEHLVLEDADERRRHLLASARRIPVGASIGAVLVLREITAQLDQEARLIELALHDPLTGLANRYLLQDHLDRTLRVVRSRGGTLALAYLDLDDFKSVNDRYGHEAGDEVLMAIARRLQSTARASDLVARLSGDEFVVVTNFPGLDGNVVDLVISRIAKVLGAPYRIGGRSLSIGVSIGWVVADPRTDDPTSLLVRADEEMYRRKQQRRRQWTPLREAGDQA